VKNILFVIFFVLGLGVVAVLILLLNPNTKTEQNIQISKSDIAKEIINTRVIKKKETHSWINKITPSAKQEYLYPVTELHIKLN